MGSFKNRFTNTMEKIQTVSFLKICIYNFSSLKHFEKSKIWNLWDWNILIWLVITLFSKDPTKINNLNLVIYGPSAAHLLHELLWGLTFNRVTFPPSVVLMWHRNQQRFWQFKTTLATLCLINLTFMKYLNQILLL